MMKRILDDIAATFLRASRRLAVGGVVTMVAAILVTPPAAAQNGSAWLTPDWPEALESSGEVVITVSMWRAGRVAYRTIDGACQVTFSPGGTPPDASCSGDEANSPEDYTATSGELIFTTGGSKTITVPIVHDSIEDSGEAFTLIAWEEANADPWIDRGDSVIVSIYDEVDATAEEDSAAPAQGNSSVSPAAGRQSTGPGPAAGAAGARPLGTTAAEEDAAATSASTPSSDLSTALPGGDISAGTDIELAGDNAADRPSDPAGRRRSSPLGLAAGLAIAAVGLCVLASLLGRRQRRSPEHD